MINMTFEEQGLYARFRDYITRSVDGGFYRTAYKEAQERGFLTVAGMIREIDRNPDDTHMRELLRRQLDYIVEIGD